MPARENIALGSLLFTRGAVSAGAFFGVINLSKDPSCEAVVCYNMV